MRWLLAGAASGAAVGCAIVVWYAVLQELVTKVARGGTDYELYLLIQFAVLAPLGALIGLLPGSLLALLVKKREPGLQPAGSSLLKRILPP